MALTYTFETREEGPPLNRVWSYLAVTDDAALCSYDTIPARVRLDGSVAVLAKHIPIAAISEATMAEIEADSRILEMRDALHLRPVVYVGGERVALSWCQWNHLRDHFWTAQPSTEQP